MGIERLRENLKEIGQQVEEIENDAKKEIIDGLYVYFDLFDGEGVDDVHVSVSCCEEEALTVPLSKIIAEAIGEAEKAINGEDDSGMSPYQLRALSKSLKMHSEKINEFLEGIDMDGDDA